MKNNGGVYGKLWVIVGVVSMALAGLRAPGAAAQGPDPVREFVFTAHGDHGEYDNPATRAGFHIVAETGAAFSLGLGDMSYESVGDEARWCATIQKILGPTYPFEIVLGNHEDADHLNGDITAFARDCPDRLNAQGLYGAEYYFDYPATDPLLRVIMLGAGNDWDWNGDGTLAPNEVFDYDSATAAGRAHLAWLVDAIDTARRSGVEWIVVGMHKNCLTIGEKSCEIGPDLLNLLVEKRVDLILQGHDHNYQRSKQLALGPGCPSIRVAGFDADCVVDVGAEGVYTRGAGTILIVTGHFGGTDLYDVSPRDAETGYFAKAMGKDGWYDFLQSDKPHPDVSRGFVKVTVSEYQLRIEQVSTTNPASTFTDVFTIEERAPVSPPVTPSAVSPDNAERLMLTTLAPVADGYVNAAEPETNYGTNKALRTDADPDMHSYLRFDASAISGTVRRATLLVYANSASSAGVSVQRVNDSGWDETGLDYTTAPALGPVVAASEAFAADTWVLVDVTALVRPGEPVDLALTTTGSTAVSYSSREGAYAPQLVIEYVAAPAVSALPARSTAAAPAAAVPPAPAVLTVTPVADVYAHADNPDTNYGDSTGLRLDAAPDIRGYVRFAPQTIAGPVLRATLRVYVVSASPAGFQVAGVRATSWDEAALTYASAPALGPVIAESGAVRVGTWAAVDVTPLVTGNGPVNLALTTTGSTALRLSSREGLHPPELVIEYDPAAVLLN